MDLAKTQLQVQGVGSRLSRNQLAGPMEFVQRIYAKEGVRGVFRGYTITLVRDVPTYGVYFYSYAYICHRFTAKEQTTHDLGVMQLFLAGGLAGCIAWLACYPVDIIKSRIQAEPMNPSRRYSTIRQATRLCYQEGGLYGFFRGLSACLVRAFPVNAATLGTVTLVSRALNRGDPDYNGL